MDYDHTSDGTDLFVDDDAVETADAEVTAEADAGTNDTTETATDADHSTETADENATDDTPTEEQTSETPAADQPQTVRVKFKGQDVDVPITDAAPLLQKGMNYDNIFNELEAYRRELGFYANQNGTDLKGFMEILRSDRHARTVENEAAKIKAKYPDMPDEAAREMAEATCKGMEQESAKIEQERAAAAEEERLAPWRDLLKLYPDIKDESQIPPGVMAEINSGIRPVEAMQRHDNAQLQKKIDDLNIEIATLKKNAENKEKALPPAGTTAKPTESDAFLTGLGF